MLTFALVLCLSTPTQLSHRPELQRYFPDHEVVTSDLFFYDGRDMPRCHQMDIHTSIHGVHSSHYNIAGSADPKRKGNPNKEFPWDKTAGTGKCRGVFAVKAMSLPIKDGKLVPIVYYMVARGRRVVWLYPEGTTFLESLVMKDAKGKYRPFELRQRTKTGDGWSVDIFRPVRNLEHWRQIVGETPIEGEQRKRVHSGHLRHAYDSTEVQCQLGKITPEQQDTILSQPFVSVLGESFTDTASAPTTRHRGHFIPAGYQPAYAGADRVDCMRCHTDTQTHADAIDFGRDWYGRVRGSDGIFSWHPFDHGCISRNGFSSLARIRKDFIERGILAPYSSKKHSHYYNTTPDDESPRVNFMRRGRRFINTVR